MRVQSLPALFAFIFLLLNTTTSAGQNISNGDLNALPDVAEDFEIRFVAKEPLTRNPCAMAFDFQGRLFVGMGPQYRSPRPDTPGDSVYIMLDSDDDGVFDDRHQFATGFNNIQGLCWHGDDLWVANAPDLTIVRDTDGDDVADKYIRLYTDLGNLEHGLHGLTWGPDGRMYMSKGNSKGHNGPELFAPKAFHDLAGVPAPAGTPDFPKPHLFNADDYVKTYHDPADDWGREGGVLSCSDMGLDLRIESRGYRNPWDIAFDHEFNFVGTDNDQDQGDRVFHSFHGAHYGWGHPWSAHWRCDNHLPTPELVGPMFGGSGTGTTYLSSPAFPPELQGVWLFNDWLQRRTHFFRPAWKGAQLTVENGQYQTLVSGGDALFKPTDLEVGPNGALYVLGWGREYGVEWDENQQQINEGRIFEVSWKHNTAQMQLQIQHQRWKKPLAKWTAGELIDGLNDLLAVRRIAAQEELINRPEGPDKILRALQNTKSPLTRQQCTWALWAFIRSPHTAQQHTEPFLQICLKGPVHQRIQAIRCHAYNIRHISNLSNGQIPLDSSTIEVLSAAITSEDARLRFEAYQFLNRIGHFPPAILEETLQAIGSESDSTCFYAAWHVLKTHMSNESLDALLRNPNQTLQLAALLAAAERKVVSDAVVAELLKSDSDLLRQTAALWATRKKGNSMFYINHSGGQFADTLNVTLLSYLKPSKIYYTLDSSTPDQNSARWPGRLNITRSCTLKVAVYSGSKQIGPVAQFSYQRISAQSTAERQGILSIHSVTNRQYRVASTAPAPGAKVYTDREYEITKLSPELQKTVLVQTPNDDSDLVTDRLLALEFVMPTTIFLAHDKRIATPEWLADWKISEERLETNDTIFDVYRLAATAGKIELGGNRKTERGSASHYVIFLKPGNLTQLSMATTLDAALAKLPTAEAKRGQALFFANGGAGCHKCHSPDPSNTTTGFGPNLSFLREQKKPMHIFKSLLTPSAEIKEGFATQVIITTDGRTITGILRNETAEVVLLNQPNGETISIGTNEIEERFTQKVSAMPAFDRMLTSQQTADVVKYLLNAASQ